MDRTMTEALSGLHRLSEVESFLKRHRREVHGTDDPDVAFDCALCDAVDTSLWHMEQLRDMPAEVRA